MLKYRHFLKEELKVTFYLIIILSLLSFSNFFVPYNAISWFSMLFFFFFHMGFGYYATRGLRKPIFIYIFMGGMAAEFVLSIIFVAIWVLYFKPINKTFIIPFFLIFAIYKTFSTAILLKYFNKEDDVSTT